MIAGLSLVLTGLAANQLEGQLTRSFESKGEAIALAMATSTEQNLSGDIALVQGAVDENKVIFAVKYIFVMDDRGRPYVHTFAPVFPPELMHVNPGRPRRGSSRPARRVKDLRATLPSATARARRT